MLKTIYALLWILFIAVFGILYLTENLFPMTAVVLGFLAIGLIFAGLMALLPAYSAGHLG